MSKSAELCCKSAIANGVHVADCWTPMLFKRSPGTNMIYERNRALFDQPRAFGFWSWKPAIILAAISEAEADFIVYADAGLEIINNLNFVIDRMGLGDDLWLFANQWQHSHWTKRDAIDKIWPGSDWDDYGKQTQASMLVIRVSDYSRRFVEEWLGWCLFEGGRLVDDSPSRAQNHAQFTENRHDQSLLCTLAYRERIKLHYWAASYNDGAFTYPKDGFESDNYPILVNHHRKRNLEFLA